MQDDQLALEAPVLISDTHALLEFESGEPVLDDWLKNRALANLESGASRTYVVVHKVHAKSSVILASAWARF